MISDAGQKVPLGRACFYRISSYRSWKSLPTNDAVIRPMSKQQIGIETDTRSHIANWFCNSRSISLIKFESLVPLKRCVERVDPTTGDGFYWSTRVLGDC